MAKSKWEKADKGGADAPTCFLLEAVCSAEKVLLCCGVTSSAGGMGTKKRASNATDGTTRSGRQEK